MSDSEPDTNDKYYQHLWTKPLKKRTTAKKVKPKRSLKKTIVLGDMLVRSVKDVRRFHNKRIDATHSPLLRG